MLKTALTEGIIEMARVFLVTVSSVMITYATGLINTVSGDINISSRVVISMLLLAILTGIGKGIDKGLHVYGKLTNDPMLVTGLTRF